MKKNLFKIVAGLSEGVVVGADQFSKAISGLGRSIFDQGKIQMAVNDIFLKVPEKQAKDFVSFVLSESRLTIQTKILVLQNFLLPSEAFKNSLPLHLTIDLLTILVEKFNALQIKSVDPNDSGCPPSPVSSASSAGRLLLPIEEDFGFGPDEFLAETLSVGTVRSTSSTKGYIYVNPNTLSSEPIDLIRYALNIYVGLPCARPKDSVKADVVKFVADKLIDLGIDYAESLKTGLLSLGLSEDLKAGLTPFIDAVSLKIMPKAPAWGGVGNVLY